MHTRRMATFLLGVWIGCSVLMGMIAVQDMRAPSETMTMPAAPAAQIMKKLSGEEARLLLRYQAAEQNRRYLYTWEEVQLGLGLAVAACLFLATERRTLPLVFCGMMILLVVFEHFAITPEMIYRGRQADFPPGSAALGTLARVWVLEEIYIGVDVAKAVIGILLTGYLFVFHARSRVRRAAPTTQRAIHT
jgi:hypothetical protein